MIEAGAMLAINTDAHHADALEETSYGVITARRGWAGPEHILNTKTLPSLRNWLARKRS